MKNIVLYALPLLCSGCLKYYKFESLQSSTSDLNVSGMWVTPANIKGHKKDVLRVSLRNVSESPVFIDWSKATLNIRSESYSVALNIEKDAQDIFNDTIFEVKGKTVFELYPIDYPYLPATALAASNLIDISSVALSKEPVFLEFGICVSDFVYGYRAESCARGGEDWETVKINVELGSTQQSIKYE